MFVFSMFCGRNSYSSLRVLIYTYVRYEFWSSVWMWCVYVKACNAHGVSVLKHEIFPCREGTKFSTLWKLQTVSAGIFCAWGKRYFSRIHVKSSALLIRHVFDTEAIRNTTHERWWKDEQKKNGTVYWLIFNEKNIAVIA